MSQTTPPMTPEQWAEACIKWRGDTDPNYSPLVVDVPATEAAIVELARSHHRTAERLAAAESLIGLAKNAIDLHPQWCGFNADSPGHPAVNEFGRALNRYLDTATGECR